LTATLSNPIFIMGVARSGTTLAQRLLNTYDDVLIWGEHEGVLRHLANTFYQGWEGKLLFEKERVDWKRLPNDVGNRTHQSWMNGFRRQEWKDAFRKMLNSLFVPEGLPGKKWWGFKDVSYGCQDRTIEFLQEIYPGAIFVFVIRNIYNVLASRKVFYDQGVEPLASLREGANVCHSWVQRNRAFYQWHCSGKIHSHWVRYEELIRGEGAVLNLLGFIGKSFGEKQRELLKQSSGRNSSFEFGDAAYDDRWRTLPALWLAAAKATAGSFNQKMGYEDRFVPVWRCFVVRLLFLSFRIKELFLRSFHKLGRFLKNCVGLADFWECDYPSLQPGTKRI